MRQYEIGQGPRCLFGNMDRLWVLAASPCHMWAHQWLLMGENWSVRAVTFMDIFMFLLIKKKREIFLIRLVFLIYNNIQSNVDFCNNVIAIAGWRASSLMRFIKVCNIIFPSRFLHSDFSPSNPARSKWGPTGCRVLGKRCNPKIMSDYGTLSLTSWDCAVTPLTEKKPLPMPSAIFGFVDARNTPLP